MQITKVNSQTQLSQQIRKKCTKLHTKLEQKLHSSLQQQLQLLMVLANKIIIQTILDDKLQVMVPEEILESDSTHLIRQENLKVVRTLITRLN